MKKGYFYLVLAIISMPFAIADTSLSHSQAIELAKQTLAKQGELPAQNIELESAKAVQWPDSSLGCPQPGMMYAQIITPGYRVTLMESPNGKRHFVHIGAGRAIVCNKTNSTRSQTEKNLRFGKRWQQSQKAQQLLSDRLSVSRDKIRIVGARTIENKKAGPLCIKEIGKGKPTKTHIQVIELSHHKQVYRYAVIDNRLVYCD